MYKSMNVEIYIWDIYLGNMSCSIELRYIHVHIYDWNERSKKKKNPMDKGDDQWPMKGSSIWCVEYMLKNKNWLKIDFLMQKRESICLVWLFC